MLIASRAGVRALEHCLGLQASILALAGESTAASKKSSSRVAQLSPRFFGASACSQSDLQEEVIVVPMPQLSPHMSSGRISKWLKQAGDDFSTYDVLFEVETESLSEEAYKVGDFAGSVTMLVEAQEDGFLERILVEEGEEVKVDTPVAIMSELEGGFRNREEELQDVLEKHEQLRRLTWQSYLKESKDGPKGCN